MHRDNFYIFTGGPGSGKSTLLDELEKRGYRCVNEVVRNIIREQMLVGGTALPWKDTRKYTELMLHGAVKDYKDSINISLPIFFDRGIPDILAYTRLIDLKTPAGLLNAVKEYRYNNTVFLFPPWEEIYHMDNERKQTFQVAEETYRQIKKTYEKLDYRLLVVPKLPVLERAGFILENLQLENI